MKSSSCFWDEIKNNANVSLSRNRVFVWLLTENTHLKHKIILAINDYNKPWLSFCCHTYSQYQHLPLLAQVSCFTEPCDWCSSSLPQTQSAVVLIKLCAALLTSSPMVILGHSQCDGGRKPPREPIRASISPYGGFHALISLNQPHMSKHWAWVWLWNLSSYCWFRPHMGTYQWVWTSALDYILHF